MLCEEDENLSAQRHCGHGAVLSVSLSTGGFLHFFISFSGGMGEQGRDFFLIFSFSRQFLRVAMSVLELAL